ncbi:IS1249 family transposase [soil metagenome]
MQKRGKTAQGKQRWLCANCSKSRSLGHDTQKQGRLLDRFVAWLLGKQSQSELGVSSERTWRRQTSWCWKIIPKPLLTGEAHAIVLIDATQIGNLACLIARTLKYVINWHWAGWESSNTWEVLLSQLPAPLVVVCDGQKGILLAIARCWPKTRIQRCLFHIWQNMRTKLTLNPQTEAGQELLALYRQIWDVKTVEQAEVWQAQFQHLYSCYASFLKQRTYLQNPKLGQRKWWYTHRGVRSAYRQIDKLLEDNQLFTYLDANLLNQTKQAIPTTTNYVEGGINSQLKEKLKLHRGLSQTHQQRLVDWYLYARTEDPKPPRNVL